MCPTIVTRTLCRHACSLATVPLLMSIGGVVSYEAVNHHYAAHFYYLYVCLWASLYLWATMQAHLNLTKNKDNTAHLMVNLAYYICV